MRWIMRLRRLLQIDCADCLLITLNGDIRRLR
jgi:hypothetical protein